MDDLGFGNCSNEAECEAVCPKEISDRQHRADAPGVHPGARDRRRPLTRTLFVRIHLVRSGNFALTPVDNPAEWSERVA